MALVMPVLDKAERFALDAALGTIADSNDELVEQHYADQCASIAQRLSGGIRVFTADEVLVMVRAISDSTNTALSLALTGQHGDPKEFLLIAATLSKTLGKITSGVVAAS